LEYSRSRRKRSLRQEFGSWLLEEHIEIAVIATKLTGEICFWNRFATKLYQHTREEAMGQNVVKLISTKMTAQQETESTEQMGLGNHWKGIFHVQTKDKTESTAHVTNTPIVYGAVKFIVNVSDDYTQLHDTIKRLDVLN
jgi:PAS domain S-box-containing protein